MRDTINKDSYEPRAASYEPEEAGARLSFIPKSEIRNPKSENRGRVNTLGYEESPFNSWSDASLPAPE